VAGAQQDHDPRRQQVDRVVAGEERRRCGKTRADAEPAAGPGEQQPQRKHLERDRERVRARDVAEPEHPGVHGEEQHREEADPGAGAAREQREEQQQRRSGAKHRDQLGGNEEIAHDKPRERERDLESRAHDPVAGGVDPAHLDHARPVRVAAVEVGLGEVVADPVRAHHHGEEPREEQHRHGDREAGEPARLGRRDPGRRIEGERAGRGGARRRPVRPARAGPGWTAGTGRHER